MTQLSASALPTVPHPTFSISDPVDILILGTGWTSTFLIPLCQSRNLTYASTSRLSHPKEDTITFEFDPTSDDPEPYKVLPKAKTVLITFPIKVKGASERLVKLYAETHPELQGEKTGFIQLGSTGIWDVSESRYLRVVHSTHHPPSSNVLNIQKNRYAVHISETSFIHAYLFSPYTLVDH